MADGRIIIDTKVDSAGAEKDVKGLGNKLGGLAKGSFSIFTKGAIAASAALGGLGAVSVNLASDLGEVQNVVDTTFGDNATKINDWAKSAATAFGMSELQAKQFNGTLGAMLKSMGLTNDQVLNMSESMVGLAGDFASFYNLPAEEAFAKIRAEISGETEPLKQLGINMSVANLEAYALAQGINKQYKEMTQAEQATLRYNYLMSVSADAQGDFAKTADSLANQLRMAKLNVQDLGSVIGSALIPMAQDAVKELNGMVDQLKSAFNEDGFNGLATTLGSVLSQIIVSISLQAPKFIDMGIVILKNLVAGIQKNMSVIATSAVDIITSLILGFLDLLPRLLDLGATAVIELISGVMKALPQLIIAAVGIIQTLAKGIMDSFPQLIPTIISIITGICDTVIANIGTIVDIGINLLLALIQGIMDSLPILIEKVPQIINNFSSAIYAQLPKILKAGIDILLMLIKGLIDSIPTLLANIPQIIMAIVNVVTLYNWWNLGSSVVTKIGDGIEALGPKIGTIAANIANKVSAAITNVFKGGLSWGKNLISSIGSGFSSMISFLGSSARSVASGALEGIKSIFSGGFNIGKNLIEGIWNGISNMKKWILDKIGGFAGSVISGIKDFFGIHSPSRVMRDQVGKYLAQGVGVGFEDETSSIEKSINKSLLGTISSFNVDEVSAKLTAAVYQEQASVSRKMTSGVDKTINNTNTVTNNNDNGLNINIDKFENNRPQDVKALAEELEFYRKQSLVGEGVK